VNVFCNTSNQNLYKTGSTCTMNGRMKGKPAPAAPFTPQKTHTHTHTHIYICSFPKGIQKVRRIVCGTLKNWNKINQFEIFDCTDRFPVGKMNVIIDIAVNLYTELFLDS